MGAEEAWKNPDFTLDNVWRQAAERGVTISWVGPGLPAQRPDGLDTGLVYSFWQDGLSWEEAPQCVASVQSFWVNG
jgi:hypothetical protein